MSFDIYKRKFEDQPFPRKHIKSFDTIDQVMGYLKLTPEEAIEALVGADVRGYEIEQNLRFLGDGITQPEIAEILHTKPKNIEMSFARAINKMKSSGKLREFLELVRSMRTRQYSTVQYSEKITLEA